MQDLSCFHQFLHWGDNIHFICKVTIIRMNKILTIKPKVK